MSPLPGTTDALDGHVKDHTYDAIIVGGGLTGMVLASRLSEEATKSVLVVEAGSSHIGDPKIDTPGLMGTLWEDAEYDWGFWTEPQKHLNGRQIQQPRGKGLGGSSAVNYTAILYPTRKDFDCWTALGNKGWSFNEMRDFFKKFHTFTPGSKDTNDLLGLDGYMDMEAQGTTGPLSVTHTDTYGPFNAAWNEVFDQLGMHDKNDPINCEKMGAFTPSNSIKSEGKIRSYSVSAYYSTEVAARPNLTVVTEAQVMQVLFDPSAGTPRARAVRILTKDGEQCDLQGSQIILCAGALQSPQILELSGIGAPDVLARHHIQPVVTNAGVGENLQDHSFASISFEVADGQISGDVLRDPEVINQLLKLYNDTRSGPFSGMPMSIAYLPAVDDVGVIDNETLRSLIEKYDNFDSEATSPGVRAQREQIVRMLSDPSVSCCQSGILATQMHFNPGKTSMSQATAKLKPGNYISFTAGLNHPLSRGSVHIRSRSVQDAPAIDPNYLSHPLDLGLTARCLQFVHGIATKSPMKELLKQPLNTLPENVDLSDLEVAKKTAKDRLYTTFHPSGTCAMLPLDLGGVVDDRCNVHGTHGLRVVDASIFPVITQGNIQATVYAVAEKAAEMIKADWRL